MKKLLSLVLALMMMLSCVCVFAEGESGGGSAGEPEDAGSTTISLSAEELSAELVRVNTPLDFAVIPADETTGQEELSYVPGTTAILEVDGLKFKDMNKNGQLDVYEDWRKSDDDRIVTCSLR